MDAITHTIIVCLTIYISFRIGRSMSTKGAIQKYTKHLEDEGYVYIEKMRDGGYEFIRHWKRQEDNT